MNLYPLSARAKADISNILQFLRMICARLSLISFSVCIIPLLADDRYFSEMNVMVGSTRIMLSKSEVKVA